MQEQKEFATKLFGFEKKAVLEYIYEQDKQARAALTDLAGRNATLDDKLQEISAQLEKLSAQCDELHTQSLEKDEQLSSKTDICNKLQDRLDKQNASLRDKENSLQLQMEINRKMQNRITEQNTLIDSLRGDLKKAEGRCRLFENTQRDYSELHDRLDMLRDDFKKRIDEFEQDFKTLEEGLPFLRPKKVVPHFCGNSGGDRQATVQPSKTANDPSQQSAQRSFSTILKEWK